MATVQQLVDRSYRLLGQLSSGEDPTDDESNDAFTTLNAMIGSWNNERLICYALQEETLSFTAAVSNTIGPSGDLVTTRPVEIVQAWVVSSNTSVPVLMISDEEYGAIPDKTATSTYPFKANYKASMPNGTIYYYPVPSTTGTMKLLTRTPLTAFTALTDTVSLPPGWEDTIAYNLAVRIAPEIPISVPAEVLGMARETLAGIKRMNGRPMKAYTELGYLVSARGRGNIIQGQP